MPTHAELAVADRQDCLEDFAGMRVHLIGIGGCGMSGAAGILLKLGANVSGSDLVPFEGMGPLVGGGARVAIGHREEQLDPNVELVVISAAIPASNPELAAARAHGIRVMKYAELVGALMRRHKGMAIAGTHGKSTTTAMCAHLCRRAGLDPSFLVGARSEQLGGNSGVGFGPHFIVEACEFDRSFLHFTPESATILNLEPDHLDCYHNFDEVINAFGMFAARVNPDGLLVCNAEDRKAMEAASRTKAPIETLGFEPGADWRAVNLRSDHGCYSFDVLFHESRMMSTRLSIPGRYNVGNALAAMALAYHAGADPSSIARAVPAFAGVRRRLSWCGEGRGVTIIDDYAHHPTEIRVTIEAARYRYEPKRTWVIFQPHQHSRTRYFMDQFAQSFVGADEIIVPDVYAAREPDVGEETVSSQELVSRICKSGGHARYFPSLAAVTDHVSRNIAAGDLVLTMGAGDVWKVADELVERIRQPDGV
jgi:UDP-N-acetylmuramate--alanine ligase